MDPVTYQTMFNVAASLLAAVFGWVLRILWESMKSQQEFEREMTKEMGEVRTLVAGKYVTREELRHDFGKIEGKLDTIFTELRSKADK